LWQKQLETSNPNPIGLTDLEIVIVIMKGFPKTASSVGNPFVIALTAFSKIERISKHFNRSS
jgi:hypothetical protein